MPPARLFIREAGSNRFEAHNGDYPDQDAAETEGQRLCREGNVEAFEVWTRAQKIERVWDFKEVKE